MLAKERGQLKEQKQKLEGKLQVLKVCYCDLCSYVLKSMVHEKQSPSGV